MTAQMCTFAHSLTGVEDPKDKLVLAQIALHADPYGDCALSWAELEKATGIGHTAMADVLNRLCEGGWLARGRWGGGRATAFKKTTMFSLQDRFMDAYRASIGEPVKAGQAGEKITNPTSKKPAARHGVGKAGQWTGDGMDKETFRNLVKKAEVSQWNGEAANQLGRLVEVESRARLAWLARRRPNMSFEEAMDDLTSRVWETIQTETATILNKTDDPWAWLAGRFRRELARLDTQAAIPVEPSTIEEIDLAPLEAEASKPAAVALRDLFIEHGGGPGFHAVVELLIEAGVPHGLAANGTRRMVEIAATVPWKEAITVARKDSQLTGLGVTSRAAGAWMALIVGKRRQGAQSAFLLRAVKNPDGPANITLTDEDRSLIRTIQNAMGLQEKTTQGDK